MQSTPSERYKLLVGLVKAHLGGGYGWRAECARMMDVAPSYLAKIDAGEAGEVGGAVIQRAIVAMGLHPSFFYAPQTPRDFTSYQGHPTDDELDVLEDHHNFEVAEVREGLRRIRQIASQVDHQSASGPSAVDVELLRELAAIVSDLPLVAASREVVGSDDAFFVVGRTREIVISVHTFFVGMSRAVADWNEERSPE